MNTKQKKVFEALFIRPTSNSISWNDIENLIITLGGKIKEGKGSAGAFILKHKVFPFHRPHPQKEAKRYQVDNLRKFLVELGITP